MNKTDNTQLWEYKSFWTAIKYAVVYPIGFILISGFTSWLFNF